MAGFGRPAISGFLADGRYHATTEYVTEVPEKQMQLSYFSMP